MISLATLLRNLPSLKYLMVGAFCALLNIVMQSVFMLVFGAHYALSTGIAFVILLPLSFFLHKKVTFQTRGAWSPSRFALYTLQWLVLLAANMALLGLFVDVMRLHATVGLVLVTLISHIISFLYSRRFVFQEKTDGA